MFTEQDIKEFVNAGLALKKIPPKKDCGVESFKDEELGITFRASSLGINGKYMPQNTQIEYYYAAFSYYFVEAIKKMIEENELNVEKLEIEDGKFKAKYQNIDAEMIKKYAKTTLLALNEIDNTLFDVLKNKNIIKKISIPLRAFNNGGKQILETFASSDLNLDTLCNVILAKNGQNSHVKTTKLEKSDGRKIEMLYYAPQTERSL